MIKRLPKQIDTNTIHRIFLIKVAEFRKTLLLPKICVSLFFFFFFHLPVSCICVFSSFSTSLPNQNFCNPLDSTLSHCPELGPQVPKSILTFFVAGAYGNWEVEVQRNLSLNSGGKFKKK